MRDRTTSSTFELPRLRSTVTVLGSRLGELRLRRGDHDLAIDDPPAWLSRLLATLDGRRAPADIARDLRAEGFELSDGELSQAIEDLGRHRALEDAVHDRLLSPAEHERYDRQLRYFADRAPSGHSAVEYQVRLREAHVAVLGLGALGGQAALGLVAAGVGRITALDGDVVELSNLSRQTLYTQSDVGRAKANAAVERLAAVNSHVEFRVEHTWLTSSDEIERGVGDADFVVDAVDNPPYVIERWVNEACFRLGKPFIAMSHYPPHIRVGPTYVPGITGCYRCQEEAWRGQDASFDADPSPETAPAIAPTSAAVGALVTLETIHQLTGIAPPATLGVAVLIDLATLAIDRRPVVRLDSCTVCSVGGATRPAHRRGRLAGAPAGGAGAP